MRRENPVEGNVRNFDFFGRKMVKKCIGNIFAAPYTSKLKKAP